MLSFLEHLSPSAANNASTQNDTDSKAPLRTFFDHGHTQRNKMIIYDDDPRIQAVMKAAHDRHKDNMQDYESYIKHAEDKHRELNEVRD